MYERTKELVSKPKNPSTEYQFPNDMIMRCFSSNLCDVYQALDELYSYVFMLFGEDFESFCRKFSYQDFLNLAIKYEGKPEGTLALSIFATCCISSYFPFECFSGKEIIRYFFKLLDSNNPDVNQASLQILTVLSANNTDTLMILIENYLVEKMMFLPLSIEFANMVYLLSSIKNYKINQIIELIPLLLSSNDIDIINNGLCSMSSILDLYPESRETMEQIIISSSNDIFNLDDAGFEKVCNEYFSLLSGFENLSPNFITPIFNKMINLKTDTVILKGNYIFRKQKKNWFGIIDSILIFYLIEMSLDNTYEIQKSSLMTLMLYYHFDLKYDSKVTKQLIKFLEDSDLSVACLSFLTKMTEHYHQNNSFLNDIEDVIPTIETFCTSDNIEICEEASKFLKYYKSL